MSSLASATIKPFYFTDDRVGEFYAEHVHHSLVERGVVHIELKKFPFSVNNRKLTRLKENVALNFKEFSFEQDKDGGVTINRNKKPAPCRKTHRLAYVNGLR